VSACTPDAGCFSGANLRPGREECAGPVIPHICANVAGLVLSPPVNHTPESHVAQKSFPLFTPARQDIPDEATFSVSGMLDREVRRAALDGPDPDAIQRQRITLDVDVRTLDALQALALATGSSRRSMAHKLLEAATWEAVNDLCSRGQGSDSDPLFAAVYDEFSAALDALRKERDA
jgi:hypothetical protein